LWKRVVPETGGNAGDKANYHNPGKMIMIGSPVIVFLGEDPAGAGTSRFHLRFGLAEVMGRGNEGIDSK
jgi:hypothetical protein